MYKQKKLHPQWLRRMEHDTSNVHPKNGTENHKTKPQWAPTFLKIVKSCGKSFLGEGPPPHLTIYTWGQGEIEVWHRLQHNAQPTTHSLKAVEGGLLLLLLAFHSVKRLCSSERVGVACMRHPNNAAQSCFFWRIPSGLITPRMGEEEVGFFWGEGEKKSLGLIFTPHGEGFFGKGNFHLRSTNMACLKVCFEGRGALLRFFILRSSRMGK